MALVRCGECGKQVSNKAATCPSCGAKPNRTKLSTWIVAGLGIMVIITLMSENSQQPTKGAGYVAPQKSSAQKRHEAAVQRAAMGAMALKKNMRNPDMFKLSSIIEMSTKALCFEYRAQNGFGGMNVERAVLAPDDKSFLNSSAPGFDRLWSAWCANKTGSEILNDVQLYL